ncbi:MAG: LPXTG cell wall anchor domain-containing protein [Chlamydiales bacterium]|nr:LPXTG cell wall anchor domain-containing protein [Chlamydiales bacterium]
MNIKQIVGLVVLLAGIVAICFGFYGTSRMASARQDINTATGFIPENRIKGAVSGALHGEVDKYKGQVTTLFVAGGILIICGGALMYFGRKKR